MTPDRAAVCAIVVTFNRLAQLRQTLAHLLAEPLDRIVVVDNASTDGTDVYLRGLNDPRLDHFRLNRNLGGAGGFEAGMRHAVTRYDPRWMLLQDDDAWPAPGMIARFHAAETTGCAAIATAVRTPDDKICDMNRPLFNPFRSLRVFLRTALGGGRRAFHLADTDYTSQTPMEVDGASFVGLFVSRRAVELAGYPDTRLFLYADDALFCHHLRQAGGNIVFMPDLHYTHDCTSLDANGTLTPDWKLYFYHRNLLILYRAAAGRLFWPALLVIVPKWMLRLWTGGGNRRRRVRLMLWGLHHGLRRDTRWSLLDLQGEIARRNL